MAPPELLGVSTIKQVLGSKQAVLRLQPIYDVATAAPVQHEVLLRLLDSAGHEVMPQQFLRAVVQHNLLPALDTMTLALLESQLRVPPTLPATPLAVNISARSLGHPGYIEFLTSPRWLPVLHRIVLELKIGDLMMNGQNIGKLAELKQHGLGISLNYQTGGATIAKLVAQMGFDFLKFDARGFCLTYTDSQRMDAVEAIQTAQGHGIKVVFEGVETEQDLAGVRPFKPDLLQGFLFGWPQFNLTTGKTPVLRNNK